MPSRRSATDAPTAEAVHHELAVLTNMAYEPGDIVRELRMKCSDCGRTDQMDTDMRIADFAVCCPCGGDMELTSSRVLGIKNRPDYHIHRRPKAAGKKAVDN